MQYEIKFKVDMGMTHHYLNDLIHMRKIDCLGVASMEKVSKRVTRSTDLVLLTNQSDIFVLLKGPKSTLL